MLLNIFATIALLLLFHGGWKAIWRDIRREPRELWLAPLIVVAVLLILVLVAIWRH